MTSRNTSTAEATLREVPEAARALGLQIQALNASTSREIEAAFATLVHDRTDALLVAGDGFFISRRVQFATLATRHGVPAAYDIREHVEVGGLMSYGTDIPDMYRQAGVYTGQILKGAKPAKRLFRTLADRALASPNSFSGSCTSKARAFPRIMSRR